jgi:putative nucleotidyltransferase with HDIG domain
MQYVDVITNRSLYTIKSYFFAKAIEELWRHLVAVAFAARYIAEELSLKMKYDVFTLGLLHDIGKLVLFQIIGELMLKEVISKTTSFDDVKETMDKSHGKFGGVLLKRWVFDDIFIQIAIYHDELENVENSSKELLIIHFANIFVNQMGYTIDGAKPKQINLEEIESAKILGIEKKFINQLFDKVKTSLEAFMDIFK